MMRERKRGDEEEEEEEEEEGEDDDDDEEKKIGRNAFGNLKGSKDLEIKILAYQKLK